MRGRAVLTCLATLAVAVATKKVVKKTKEVSLWERLPTETAFLEVKKSSVDDDAGVGVFVAGNSSIVKAGSVLTVYGHMTMPSAKVAGTEHQPYSIPIPDDMDRMRVGSRWTRPLDSIVLRGEPVGQLINDGAFPIIDEDATPDQIPPLVDQYYDRSEHRANVMFAKTAFDLETFEMIAMRDIHPGEELFMTYGAPYWLNLIMIRADDSVMRLCIYVFISMVEPTSFLNGYFYWDRTQGRVYSSLTRREATERQAREFIVEFLKFTARERKSLAVYGMTPDMPYAERLAVLFEIATLGRDKFIQKLIKSGWYKKQKEALEKEALREKEKVKVYSWDDATTTSVPI